MTSKQIAGLKRNLIAYSLIGPGFIVFYLFIIYPLLQTVVYSLFNYRGIGSVWQSEFVGLSNFAKALGDDRFGRAFYQTLYFTFIKTGAKMLISFVLAYFLYRKLIGWKLFQLSLFMPAIVPVVVSAILWRFIFEGNFGLINSLLSLAGLEEWRYPWLSDPGTAMNAVILSAVWFSVPISMMIIFTYMIRIPNEILESARIDGASTAQIVWRIMLPLLLPTLMFLFIYSVAEDFKSYEYIMLFTDGGPVARTEVVGLYAYKQAFELSNYGYASALSLIILVFLTVVSVLILANMRKRIYEY